jgi:GNAT superfamily N-acetyltransferase
MAELTELLHRAYAPLAEAGMRFLATHQTVEQTAERCAHGECYVVETDGRLVGSVNFREPSLTDGCPWYDRPDVASFGQFAVEPSLQGSGIGSMLLDLAERRARETNAHHLALDTAEPATHLIAYYQKRGYEFVEYTQWDVSNYRSVILSKRLTVPAS